MKRILFLLFTYSLIACNQQADSNKRVTNKLSLDNSKLREDILGKWGGDSIPVWEFTKDSVYYFESSTSYHYELLDSDLVIYFPDHRGFLKKIQVANDTMIFIDPSIRNIVETYRVR